MYNKYIKGNELKDKDIIAALKKCAEDYENGELEEVLGELIDIIDAIKKFEENYKI